MTVNTGDASLHSGRHERDRYHTLVRSGETRDIHRAGGRYITLVGSNPLFHLPQDRRPHAVDTGIVTRVASAAAALVVKLTR